MNLNPILKATSGVKRSVWLVVGLAALILAGIGVILPLLPTTPFVILAAFAFGKSVPALRRRVVASRAFGPIIRDWEANGAIAPRYKLIATMMMAGVLGLSVALSVRPSILAVQAVCIAAALAFVLSRPNGPG